MTTWTETSKAAAPSYTQLVKSDAGVSEYNLAIGDGFLLEIGGGFQLIIQPSITGTAWTEQSKS